MGGDKRRMKQCDKCKNFKCLSVSEFYNHETGKSEPVKVGVCEEDYSPYYGQLIGGDNFCREFSSIEKKVKLYRV